MLERSWLIQMQAGDKKSFALLYERYWQPLYAATCQYVRARAQQQLQYTLTNSIAATDDAVAYHDLEAQLQTAVTKLSEPARTIFRLSRFEHWTNQAISEATHLAPTTVEYHLTRALK